MAFIKKLTEKINDVINMFYPVTIAEAVYVDVQEPLSSVTVDGLKLRSGASRYVTVNASNYNDQQLNISIPNVTLSTGLVINIRPVSDINNVWAIKLNNENTYAIYPASQLLNMKADRVYSFVYDYVGSGRAWHLLRGDTRIKLNNSETSSPDFYAPTTAGTADYVLQSNGANTAPSWKVGGEFIHIVKNPSGTAGNTAEGSYNRTQWAGTVDGITELYDGLTIQFKVPLVGVARGVTLNVNSLGEHPVVLQANSLITTQYPIGTILIFVYDSTQKANVYINNVSTSITGCWKTYDNNTTYANYSLGQGFGTCIPPTSGTACTVALSNYSLQSGGITAIKFSTNPVPANATFNINNKGAKPVYYNGAAIGANVIKAGDTATFMYNGTNYNLLAIDRNITDTINTSSTAQTKSGDLTAAKFIKSGGTSNQFLKADGSVDSTNYAGSQASGGAADKAVSIPFGQVDSTSTSTAFTAQIPGITELKDGVCVYLKNGVVTSASGCTLNINGLGAKPIYYSMAAASAITTHWNINHTALFVYNSSRISGGCWDMFWGYYADTNSIGFDIRELNNGSKKVKTACQRYQILLSTYEGLLLPVYSGTYSARTTKVLTTEKFNPLGQVYYYGNTTILNAGNTIANYALYSQSTYTLIDIRYSFNCGSTLVAGDDVYLVCVPQSDGSAVLHSSPLAFALPTTEDGLIYKRLGKCYNDYTIILEQNKPVYYFKDGVIRLWTGYNNPMDRWAVTNNTGGGAVGVTLPKVQLVDGEQIIITYTGNNEYPFGSIVLNGVSKSVYNSPTAQPGHTYMFYYNSPYWYLIGEQYDKGTSQDLTTGTDKSGKVWSASTISGHLSSLSIDGLKINGNNTRYVTVSNSNYSSETLSFSISNVSLANGLVVNLLATNTINSVTGLKLNSETAYGLQGFQYLPGLTMKAGCCYSFIYSSTGGDAGCRWFLIGQQYGTLTQSEITTGTDTEGKLVSAKVLHDSFAVSTSLSNGTGLIGDIKTPGFYNAGGSNSYTDRPTGVTSFGLEVIHLASGNYYEQILYNGNGSWRRYCNDGTWGAWVQDKFTDTTYDSMSVSEGKTGTATTPRSISASTLRDVIDDRIPQRSVTIPENRADVIPDKITDFNDLPINVRCVTNASDNLTNQPEVGWGMVETIPFNKDLNFLVQSFYLLNQEYYYTRYKFGTNGWQGWIKHNDKKVASGNLNYITDLNDVKENIIGYFSATATVTNVPETMGVAFTFKCEQVRKDSTYPVWMQQIYCTKGVYWRTCWNGSWDKWKKIAVTQLNV